MKKYIQRLLALTLIMVGALNQPMVAAEDVINIGILQHVEHGSYNETYRGIVEGLAEAGYIDGENVNIHYENASGNTSTLQSMSDKLARDNDVLVAIGTPAVQSLANATTKVPIYLASVTDPVGAGVAQSTEVPGGNVTGVSNLGPIAEQISLMQSVYPDAQKIGLIYNAGESNAQYQVDIAVAELEERGLTPVIQTMSSTNDISSVLSSLLPQVDTLFLVTDNTTATAMALVGDMAKDQQVGVFGGSNDMILENGLATYGLNYYDHGKQLANMLIDHIENDTVPENTPIQYTETLELIVNEDFAEAIGIDPTGIKAPE